MSGLWEPVGGEKDISPTALFYRGTIGRTDPVGGDALRRVAVFRRKATAAWPSLSCVGGWPTRRTGVALFRVDFGVL